MTSATWSGVTWDRFPTWKDPRIPFFFILFTYVIAGITVLGFNRSPGQVAVIVGTTCLLDMAFSLAFRRRLLFPLSAAITGMGLSILVNTAHGLWLPVVPAFFAIASKYLLTVNGRHIYNPNLFGLLTAVIIGGGMISPSPAYQWGGYPAISIFVVTAAIVLFATKIKRNPLIISFLIFYTINLAIRGYVTRHHVPWETIVLGTLTSPTFYLFTFFMITDPATSPRSWKGQVFMAFFISAVDLALHKQEALSTLFKAGFLYYTLMFFYRVYETSDFSQGRIKERFFTFLPRFVAIGLTGVMGFQLYQFAHARDTNINPGFNFVEIPAESLGIDSTPGNVMEQTDPRAQHLAKWILAQGDAVAIADVDNDGDQDFFLSYPLKVQESRAALYLNQGNFQFERFPLPALEDYIANIKESGLSSGGLWFDYDNDGDKDLYVVTGFGTPRLLKNQIAETGALGFVDVSQTMGINHYANSITANVSDINKDGILDLIVGNAMKVYFTDYEQPVEVNIFDLPPAEYPGDKRPIDFMHRTWHNASNGGQNRIYLGSYAGFELQDHRKWGFENNRWTLDIAIGDLNADGYPDIYTANDFGPDQLYINQNGESFKNIRGDLVGQMGRDTYKGMNATMADMNNDGLLDIYVSNVHVALQAEGSLLWINKGNVDSVGPDAFEDRAMAMNILNENRFGWGAAPVDLNLDGRLDLLQVNGMVNDNYDDLYEGCPDYWYWNDKVSLTGPEIHGYADAYADVRGRCIYPYDKKRVYINTGDYFVDVADRVGWGDTEVSRGVATADFDNDGDLDVMVSRPFAPVGIFRNDSQAGNWLGLKLVGNGITCNRDAVGTKVTLDSPSSSELPLQFREVVASNGLVSQSDQRLVFGLGDYSGEVSVNIDWCGNGNTRKLTLTHNQYHTISQ
ncbi:MAG: FG-GAP-like repeat-containing protein [Ketobacteraceae bacterium]|nr:FG-GAP-like repeat-containing protein [Ketobacteraceae bacterium]